MWRTVCCHWRRLMSDPFLLLRLVISWDALDVIHYISDCTDDDVHKLVKHMTGIVKQLEGVDERVTQRFSSGKTAAMAVSCDWTQTLRKLKRWWSYQAQFQKAFKLVALHAPHAVTMKVADDGIQSVRAHPYLTKEHPECVLFFLGGRHEKMGRACGRFGMRWRGEGACVECLQKWENFSKKFLLCLWQDNGSVSNGI